jgi:hypothetical protein
MMEALGRLFDIGTGWAPVDIDTANGATGKRIALSGADAITFVVFLGAAASGADDLTFTLKQHTAYTGGTSNNLSAAAVSDTTGVDHYYTKSETTLDNDESWVRTAQTEAATVVLLGATYAATQKIVVIEVAAAQLAEGYTHISLDASLTTTAVQLASCLYFVHELRRNRMGAKVPQLGNLLRPTAANV